ncbi:MAG: hypothetical protein OEY41_02545 [Acidimicrobiia bacterium]|nr:hypothetical protein [Acidimicrobiia bacterium]
MDQAPDHRTRKLRNQADVIAGVGFFADEIQRAYAELGFRDPGFVRNGLRMFNWQPYFLARSAPMGQVTGEVVAATFGVFPLHRVLANVAEGLQRADFPTMLATRLGATTAAMTRILGAEPAGARRATELLRRGVDHADVSGRALYAGLRSLPYPGTTVGDLWHACTLYREHRNDVHISAWTTAGLTGAQACLLNDLRQNLGFKTFVRTRGWSEEELTDAVTGLERRRLIDGEAMTAAGHELREWIEAATDAQQTPIVDAIGPDLDELLAILDPMRRAILADGAYPSSNYVHTTAKDRKGAGPAGSTSDDVPG